MSYSSNTAYTTPASLSGNDFSITLASNTHLVVTFQVDAKMMMKRAMLALICIPILLGCCFIPVLIPVLSTYGRGTFYSFNLLFPILILVMITCFTGLMYGAAVAQSKKFKTFQLVLDKDTNKMTMYTPNPYLNYKYQRSYLARLGQYLTSAWDLDSVLFRLIMPGERAGPGMSLLRGIVKNSWLVMYGDQSWLRPNILFASESAEIAQSLMNTIDNFLRNTPGFNNNQVGGLFSEKPYFP